MARKTPPKKNTSAKKSTGVWMLKKFRNALGVEVGINVGVGVGVLVGVKVGVGVGVGVSVSVGV